MIDAISQLANGANAFIAIVSTLGGVLLSLLAIKFATKREVSNVIKKAAENDEVIRVQLAETDKELQKRVRALEDGFLKVGERLNEFPTKSALNRVCLELEETQGDLKATNAELHGMRELLASLKTPVQMLVEHHLRRD